MRYEIIIFDADDTLYDFSKSHKHAFGETLDAFSITGDMAELSKAYKRVNLALWQEMEEGKIKVEELKIERFRRFFDVIGVSEDPHAFAVSYMEHLSYASFMIDGSVELVRDLAEEHTLLIVTNGLADVQNRRVRGSEIAQYFKRIIISEEVNVSKPDPGIFEAALEGLEFSKESVLMVGDRLTSDILGGINYGIDTCWYNWKGHANHEGIVPTYEVSELSQIKEIVR